MYRMLFLLFLVVIVGCVSHKDDDSDRPDEMEFTVDPELLGDAIHLDEKGIGFRPPREWTQLSDEIFDEAVQQLKQAQTDHESFSIHPVNIFLHHRHGGTLIVSEISTAESFSDPSEMVDAFHKKLEDRFEGQDVRETVFLKDGINFHQYLIQSQDNVNFKFLFCNAADELFQVDYVIPRSVYFSESKAIESSIGSIHIITH